LKRMLAIRTNGPERAGNGQAFRRPPSGTALAYFSEYTISAPASFGMLLNGSPKTPA
jgi:hypothetical protein